MLLFRSDLKQLKAHVLTMGGLQFQRDDFLAEEIGPRLAQALLRFGQKVNGRSARLFSMEPHGCHENTRRLVQTYPGWHAWTGLALSNDGVWRVHSWATNGQHRVVETTLSRKLYYGVEIIYGEGCFSVKQKEPR